MYSQVEHRMDFSGRAQSDMQILDKLLLTFTLKAFSHIIGNGNYYPTF